MNVTLRKHGGLAAGVRRPPVVVDASKLPKPAAEELARLVAAATAVPRADDGGPGRVRDPMSYTITVDDGGRQTELSQTDGALTPEFSALLHWLSRNGPTPTTG
jgi:hypothetical protein